MNDLRLQEELFELAQLENVQILPQTESKIKRFITRILITQSIFEGYMPNNTLD